MPLWKQLLLSLYYHATCPVRAWNCRREAAADHLPAIVLCWHRIADDRANPWTVSNAMFARQIRWLAGKFQFVSLEEAQRRIRRELQFPAVRQRHLRRRLRRQLPAGHPLADQGADSLHVLRHGAKRGRRRAVLARPGDRPSLRPQHAGAASGHGGRRHRDRRPRLHPCRLGRRRRPRLAAPRNRRGQGASCRRPSAGPCATSPFPYGQHANLNPAAFELAEEAGYAGVCSAYGGFNFPGDDPFHLQRIVVDGAMIRLKNWVTMDPRKLRTPRFRVSERAER